MFGINLESGLKMLKKVFIDENLKSVVLFLDEKNEVQMKKLETNLLEEFSDLMKNCPESKIYMTKKIENKLKKEHGI